MKAIHHAILKLHRGGASPRLIAKKLGLPLREVLTVIEQEVSR